MSNEPFPSDSFQSLGRCHRASQQVIVIPVVTVEDQIAKRIGEKAAALQSHNSVHPVQGEGHHYPDDRM